MGQALTDLVTAGQSSACMFNRDQIAVGTPFRSMEFWQPAHYHQLPSQECQACHYSWIGGYWPRLTSHHGNTQQLPPALGLEIMGLMPIAVVWTMVCVIAGMR